jgi:hypothetical protein
MPIDSKAQQAQLTIPTGKVDLQYGYSAVRKMSFQMDYSPGAPRCQPITVRRLLWIVVLISSSKQ